MCQHDESSEQTLTQPTPVVDSPPVHSLNGAGLLLNILGGLVVGWVVASISPFVAYLLRPFSIDAVGEVALPPTGVTILAVLAYLGFLVNMFRQIHGLGIVFEDEDYQDEVGRNLTQRDRVFSFLSAVLVIGLNGLLVGITRSKPNDPIGELLALPERLGFGPTTWVLVFYLIIVMSYWIWDFIAGKRRNESPVATSSQGVSKRGLHWRAASYQEFAANWRCLSEFSMLGSFVIIMITLFLSQEYESRNVSLIPMVTLIVLTFGYSVTDYMFNARFYFRRYRLETIRKQRGGEERMKRRPLLVICLVSAIIIIGWLAMRTGKTPIVTPHVKLQLKWIYNAGFVGDLIADKRGWSGIDVEVVAGGISTNPIKVVTSGAAQFGVATGDQMLQAVENEAAPIVAIALVYQENPLSWIVKDSSGIKQPADFRGKRVGLTFIDDEALFRAMLSRAGLSKQDLEVVPVKFDPSPFIRGDISAFPVFRNTQGVEIAKTLEKSGIPTSFVKPAYVGVISYSNMYFTTREYAKKHPKIVEAFVNGVLSGWQYAQDHPKEAAKIVAEYDKDNDIGIIEASVLATNELVKLPGTSKIGIMTKSGWEQTQEILLASGILNKRVDLDEIFTTEFIK